MKQVTNKEVIEVLKWLEYEYSLTTEHPRDEKRFKSLAESGRICLEKYANLLKKLGYKSLKDWHEREEK